MERGCFTKIGPVRFLHHYGSGLYTASCVPGAQQRLWKEMGKMRDDGMRGRHGRVSATGPRA